MDRNSEWISFSSLGWHKGFHNEEDFSKALMSIRYSDFFKKPDDDEFPYYSAHELLRGSCNHFAVALQRVLGYTPYIIQDNDKRSFHAFCQIERNRKAYYVDARGITSSFDEFMFVAQEFVKGAFTINEVTPEVVEDWECDGNYNDEAYAFAEAVIRKYRSYYTFEEQYD